MSELPEVEGLEGGGMRLPALIAITAVAVVSSVAGQQYESYSNQARPRIDLIDYSFSDLEDVDLTANLFPGQDTVSPPPELADGSAESDWIPTIQRSESRETYIDKLTEGRDILLTLREATEDLRVRLEESWPQSYSDPEDRYKVFDAIEANSSTVLGAFFGELRRGDDIFSGPTAAIDCPSGGDGLITYALDSDGDFWVHSGERKFVLYWSQYESQYEGETLDWLRASAERLSKALACGGDAELDAMRDMIEAQFMGIEDENERLLELINQELQVDEGSSRSGPYMMLGVMIVNNGDTPISFESTACLYVQDVQEGGDAWKAIEVVMLEGGSADDQDFELFEVGANRARPIRFRSRNPLDEGILNKQGAVFTLRALTGNEDYRNSDLISLSGDIAKKGFPPKPPRDTQSGLSQVAFNLLDRFWDLVRDVAGL